MSANIYTEHNLHVYTLTTKWDLASIFDERIEGMKNQIGDAKNELKKIRLDSQNEQF